jgi:hypothetical protein
MDDKFCIVTKSDGAFAMTKREFYETFPNVIASKSYKQGSREYHSKKPPLKALRFKVDL